jgi:hypothetical protein
MLNCTTPGCNCARIDARPSGFKHERMKPHYVVDTPQLLHILPCELWLIIDGFRRHMQIKIWNQLYPIITPPTLVVRQSAYTSHEHLELFTYVHVGSHGSCVYRMDINDIMCTHYHVSHVARLVSSFVWPIINE